MLSACCTVSIAVRAQCVSDDLSIRDLEQTSSAKTEMDDDSCAPSVARSICVSNMRCERLSR